MRLTPQICKYIGLLGDAGRKVEKATATAVQLVIPWPHPRMLHLLLSSGGGGRPGACSSTFLECLCESSSTPLSILLLDACRCKESGTLPL